MKDVESNVNKTGLTEYTIFNTYPDYAINSILRDLESKNFLSLKKKEENSIGLNVSRIDKPKGKLRYFLENNTGFDLKSYIDNHEWNKGYRHSVLLKIEKFNLDKLKKEIEKSKSIKKFDGNSEEKQESFMNPLYKENKDSFIFKFPIKKIAFDGNGNKLEVSYPIIVVIDKIYGILEIRFDKIKTIFQSQNFYENIIRSVIGWFVSNLELGLKQLELKPKISKIIKEYNEDMENSDVIPMKRNVALKNGSKVVLDIDANKEYVVPIIGDLKFIMKNYNKELEGTPELLKELNKLIKSVELGFVPKLSIFWKEKDILLGITHGYNETDYSLLHYYGEIISSENMDYVRDYFGKSAGKVNREEDSKQ
ncbi:hypothetical protein ACV3QH_02125 [Clostridium perfringens]